MLGSELSIQKEPVEDKTEADFCPHEAQRTVQRSLYLNSNPWLSGDSTGDKDLGEGRSLTLPWLGKEKVDEGLGSTHWVTRW